VPTVVRCGVFDCRLTFSNRARWLLVALVGVAGVALCCIPGLSAVGILLLVPAFAIMCTMACCGERRALGTESCTPATRCAWGPNCHEFGCVGRRTTFGHGSRVITCAVFAGVTTICGIVLAIAHQVPDKDEHESSKYLWDVFAYVLTVWFGCAAAGTCLSLLVCSERPLPQVRHDAWIWPMPAATST
jgi:hypothetical protein